MSWICERCNAENLNDNVKECQACLQDKEKKLFYRVNPVAEGKEDIFTIRINKEERRLLEDIKLVLDISGDSTALKIAAFRGWSVLQSTLGRDNLNWLADKNRQSRGVK